jgi:hypothetical protein
LPKPQCRPLAATKLDQWVIGIFSFVPRAPGLLISEKTPMPHLELLRMVQRGCRLKL